MVTALDACMGDILDELKNNVVDFSVGFRDGGTDYDAVKTTTSFYAYHRENDETPALTYSAGTDLAQSTDFQGLTGSVGNYTLLEESHHCLSWDIGLKFYLNQNFDINDLVKMYK